MRGRPAGARAGGVRLRQEGDQGHGGQGPARTLSVPATALFSTLGRTAARGIETLVIGEAVQGWVMELVENLKKGDSQDLRALRDADQGAGRRSQRRPARRPRALDRHRGQEDQELPVRGAVDLEPRAALRQRTSWARSRRR
ncbi:MAG: nickel-dependent hydrogenase large subunit [Desulfobacterales bacterium]|nr:nickel-dependent hydrogenase large subunit [Desulfobacterales bacterium]